MAVTDRFTAVTGSPGTTIDRLDIGLAGLMIQAELTDKYDDVFYLTTNGQVDGQSLVGPNDFPYVEVWLSDPDNPDILTQIHSSGMVFWSRQTAEVWPEQGYSWSLQNVGTPEFVWYIRVMHGGGYEEDLVANPSVRRLVWIYIIGEGEA